jgi:hypothetical protein
MRLVGVAVGLVSAAVFGVAAVVQAQAVRGFETKPDGLWGFVTRSVRDGRTMLVVGAYLVGFVLHASAIWLLPLYLAQALVAMSLPVTAGLVLLSLGAGKPGETVTTTRFVVLLWIGVAALAVASAIGRRLAGPVLGVLAGLGYAGSAISVRGIGTPIDGAVVTAALAVPVFGLIAFWLYSLGMDRAAVPSTTASLIVAQTFVPAAVGVALLGDGVRDGWWPAVILGLLLSTGGAALLGVRGTTRSRASSATR